MIILLNLAIIIRVLFVGLGTSRAMIVWSAVLK